MTKLEKFVVVVSTDHPYEVELMCEREPCPRPFTRTGGRLTELVKEAKDHRLTYHLEENR